MDNTTAINATINTNVQRALVVASKHPSVVDIKTFPPDKKSRIIIADLTFQVSLPSEWRQQGTSPSGVMSKEVVRFHFSPKFPIYPPDISLRKDFDRNRPHVQPWLFDNCPVPCICEGDIAELLSREGLIGIVDQIAIWLEKAALDTLMDPKQGWEPVRRDHLHDHIVVGSDILQRSAGKNGGYHFFNFFYIRIMDKHSDAVYGQIDGEKIGNISVNSKTIKDILVEEPSHKDLNCFTGRSLALVVWPGKLPSGKKIVSDVYLPETVRSTTELKERAVQYGCGRELKEGLSWIKSCLSKHQKIKSFPLAVILLARRPFNVIGSNNPMEICPYVINTCSPDLYAKYNTLFVRPASHHHSISRSLLIQMSGEEPPENCRRWTLLGAGSLGSKLALHLARAGQGPEVIIDKSLMSPHNAARHALVQVMGQKALILHDAIHELDQETTPITEDAVKIMMSNSTRKISSMCSWAIVNTTASAVVREALVSTNLISTRVIETSLFAGGHAGVITVEGPNRNPNTIDLMAEFYTLSKESSALASTIFDNDVTMSRQNIGHGCGSLTMLMSDGRLSLFAAGASEYLLARQRNGLPRDRGEILVSRLSDNGLGLIWDTHEVLPVTTVPTSNYGSWRIHIHERAVRKIQNEVKRWPQGETGGVLMGRFSEGAKVINVVDVLDAPEDSIHSEYEFTLGTKGLRKKMSDYSESVNWSLYSLGTWHNHHSSSGPSDTDQATLLAISIARLMPSVLLIHTPSGFRATLAQ